MTEGVDYAFSQPDPAQLYAAGKRFALRYVGPGTDDKHLHAAERDALWGAGLLIGLLAEQAAQSALGGFTEGQDEAWSSQTNARALDAPDSLPYYFAVDFDVTAGQWPVVASYLRGAASVIGLSRVGIYGGIRAMQWAARDGVAAWFFQTYAWSAGQWYPGNHLEQYQNGVQLAGGEVDLCRAKQANFGQWGPGVQPKEDEDMPHFLNDRAGTSQWMADANFERIWSFNDEPLWRKVLTAAGQSTTIPVDAADVAAGLYGQPMGLYTMPRKAPDGATLSPSDIAQVSAAAHDGAAGAIDGATVSGAVISTKKP